MCPHTWTRWLSIFTRSRMLKIRSAFSNLNLNLWSTLRLASIKIPRPKLKVVTTMSEFTNQAKISVICCLWLLPFKCSKKSTDFKKNSALRKKSQALKELTTIKSRFSQNLLVRPKPKESLGQSWQTVLKMRLLIPRITPKAQETPEFKRWLML